MKKINNNYKTRNAYNFNYRFYIIFELKFKSFRLKFKCCRRGDNRFSCLSREIYVMPCAFTSPNVLPAWYLNSSYVSDDEF